MEALPVTDDVEAESKQLAESLAMPELIRRAYALQVVESLLPRSATESSHGRG